MPANESVVQVFPVPQHMAATPVRGPLGPVVLAGENTLDLWAVTTLRRGLERLGVSLLVDRPAGGACTIVRITSDPGVLETLLARCRERLSDKCTRERIGVEGYAIDVASDGAVHRVTIAATAGAGQVFGVDTFLQLVAPATDGPVLRGAIVCDWPAVSARVYWGPGDDDRAAALRYNTGRGGRTPDDIASMRERHIEPWVGIHPSHADAGKPGLRYSDPAEVERAVAPLIEAARAGVRWLGMNFDDIDLRLGHPEDVARYGTIGRAHAEFFNTTLGRIRAVNPDARLVVIPIVYGNIWLPGTWVYATSEEEIYDYLTTIGRDTDPSVAFVWTGESIESGAMTDDDIRQWTDLVRRKPIVFENTPTGDLTDFGALKFRTPNVGDLLMGWIYIHRGTQAAIAELTTAEFLWNPRAYDPEAALRRAIRALVGDEAAPAMERLIAAFSRADNPRYRHPLWREGRLLEVAEPDDPAVAAVYEDRLRVIGETLPALDTLIPGSAYYAAVRKIALDSTDVARAYLETYRMITAARKGALADALAAGDRAETLNGEWSRYSTGSTDLGATNDRRDAMTFLEQINVAGRLRALRRGGDDPIPWIDTTDASGKARQETRHGRRCRVVGGAGESLEIALRSEPGHERWLVIAGAVGSDAVPALALDGVPVALPVDAFAADRWRSIAVPLPAGGGSVLATFTTARGEWAIARTAALVDPTPARLLHATRSTASLGERTRTEQPARLLVAADAGQVSGRLAIRTDLQLIRAASGRFFDLDRRSRLGQTFHLPAPGDCIVTPKDPVRLNVRESADGDFLHGFGFMFAQQGKTPLAAGIWRWAGSVEKTTGDAANWLGSGQGAAGTPSGSSHHWVFFPFGVELDAGEAYYVELTAPGGWTGWRIRRAFGWYGRRYDETRSAWLDGAMLPGEDIPFRTYVLDVYDARKSGGR